MTTLGIVGGGVLGKACARGFMEHCEVRVFDVIKERATHELPDVAMSEIVFVCLPTPAAKDGTCDTTAISDFLALAAKEGWWSGASCYVLRSTVSIGFTQAQAEQRKFALPLLHSPEFLTARCALTDFQTPARNIIGSPLGIDTQNAPSIDCEHAGQWQAATDALWLLYSRRFPGVPVLTMHSNASELVKLACNSFFAAKVTLFNLFYDVAQASGVPWDDVRAGILSDGRIAHAHTSVNQDGHGRGYAGSCLPKDLQSLAWCCQDLHVARGLLDEIADQNRQTRSQAE